MKKMQRYQPILIAVFILFTSNILVAQCFSKIAALHYATLGIKSDGTLWIWGADAHYFADQTSGNSNTPLRIGTDSNWSNITAGYGHVILQKSDGTLWGMGDNSSGQLGSDVFGFYTVIVQIGTGNDWSQISAGKQNHTLGIKANGTLWSWGNNQYGKLGDGTTVDKYAPTQIGTETNWVQVSAGGYHSMAIKTDGTLWTWGDNQYAALGDGTTNNRLVPTQIGTDTWAAIAAGENYSVAIKTDGTLWAWGLNNFGQLGDGTGASRAAPVKISTFTDWTKIFAEFAHNLAIRANQTLWSWGLDNYGQLGNGGNGGNSPQVQVGTDTDWNQITEGYEHSVALKNDGSLWAWGYDFFGQVGDGVNLDNWEPTLINCPNLANSTFENNVSHITVYPNPANNRLNINNNDNIEISSLSIFNTLGQLMLTVPNAQKTTTIDVSGLKSGNYFLKINSDKGLSNTKFIKL
jgi:alpha-tubulin suppressor-like RCC1 family protein